MGAWGTTPTENDAACNWLEQLFVDSQLESHVRNALHGSVHDSPDEMRAAAHLASVLIAADLWPSESKQEVKDLATLQLQRMLDEKVFTNSLMVAEIRNEIRQFDSGRQR